MKRKLMLLLACLFVGIGLVTAQTQKVTGVVVSEEDGQPVIGASVLVKGTQIGTITGVDGDFTLPNVPSSAKTLQISFIGMQTQEVAIKPNVRVALKSNAETLDEVVVVAYGTQKKESVVGAQASVNAKQLEKRPITNVSNALGGLASGVQAVTSTGQPGSGSSILIRGFGSMNASSAPLYVVDGSIYNGSLSDLSPQDIQNVSILKDAASTSLYGSSAGNGVVLITTKSGAGAKDGKPKFDLTINQGFTRRGQDDYKKVGTMDYYPIRWQQWYNAFKYGRNLDDATAGSNAAYYVWNDLKYNPYAGITSVYEENPTTGDLTVTNSPQTGTFTFPAIVMPDGTLNPEVNGLLYGDDLDWEKALFRTGYRSEYTLSGGLNTDKMQSFMSIGYLSEDGYRKHTTFERFSARANVSYTVNKWIGTGANVAFSRTHNEAPKRATGAYSSNSFAFLRGIAPIYPIHVHNADGSYALDDKGERIYDHNALRPYNARFNPVEEGLLDHSTFDRDAITSRLFAEVTFIPDLKLRGNLAYDLSRALSKTRFNNKMGDQPAGLLIMADNRYSTITFNQLLTYKKSFGNHNFDLLLGHESYWLKVQTTGMEKKGMSILGIDEMNNLSTPVSMESQTDTYTKEGYFTRLNYDYDTRYNFSISYRRDGTSRLDPDHRWGNFWSVGAGWNIARESFIEADWLNTLKVRASIGQTGNDAIGSYYAYKTLYGLGNNNGDKAGVRFARLGNRNLQWETQTSYDFAIEYRLFDKISGTVEFFNKESKDLLFSYPLPLSSGISSMERNIGKVRNYGIEFDIKANLISQNDLKWDVTLNGTWLRNKIVRLPDENREKGIENDYTKYEEGRSIYDFYLNEWIGVDPEDGLAMYRLDNVRYPNNADPNKEGFVGVGKEGEAATWTKDGRFAKKHFAGSAIPKLYGGFGTGLEWKGFDLDLAFAYQLGGKTYDGAYQGLMGRNLQGGRAMHADMYTAWKKPGDVTDVPRLDAEGGGNYDALTSDRFLISSDALLLKSIAVGYTLPKKWAKKVGLEGVRISVAGENLFLWSARQGLNPMMNYSGVTGAAFYEYAKTLTSSINIKF